MSDRELLELAAKAAGIPCDKNGPYVERQEWQQWIGEPGHYETVRVNWNPLTDDGDSRRLQVALGISLIMCTEGRARAMSHDAEHHAVEDDASKGGGTNARMAVLKCAAEIGRGMK